MSGLSRAILVCALATPAACAPRQMGINRTAAALADASAVYESDNDPEFVRIAAPSALKTIETLLAQSPNQPQLLLTACRGFTEYSYGFLHVESELKASDAAAAQDLRSRGERMYTRARDYCLRGLRLAHAGITAKALADDPAAALNATTRADVPWIYWTAVSWGAEMALAPMALARLPELAAIRALLARAKALDDTWERGAIYEALIALDGLPPIVGGSAAAARADFEKALELSGRKSVLAYVTMASVVGDQAERKRLLQEAIAIDVATLPSRRLMNLIAQRYARALLAAAR